MVVNLVTWMLGTELRSSVRASALSCLAVFLLSQQFEPSSHFTPLTLAGLSAGTPCLGTFTLAAPGTLLISFRIL